MTFADIMDGGGRIQISLQKNALGDEKYDFFKAFDLGDFVGVTGSLTRTRAGEITVQVKDFVMLAKSLHPLPEKWHGLTDVEKRYRQRYLDLISSAEVRRTFVLRGKIVAAVRRFMDGRGFVEVETPMLQSAAGGAAAKPFVTYHNALDATLNLRIATELHLKRLIVGGMDKVYEIGRILGTKGFLPSTTPNLPQWKAMRLTLTTTE